MIKSIPLENITLTVNNTVVPISFFKFSAGEIQVKLDVDVLAKIDNVIGVSGNEPTVRIVANLRSSDDIIALLMVKNAFSNWANSSCYIPSHIPVDIEIPYLPYSRQDRVCSDGEANAMSVMCRMLQTMAHTTVTTWDVHNTAASDIAPIRNISSAEFLTSTLVEKYSGGVNIVCPDKGATSRACNIRNAALRAAPNTGYVALDKTRDPKTGKLGTPGLDVMNIYDPTFPFLIVDDICDGGRTFIAAAEVLQNLFTYNKKPPVIDLYVTHGIFSAGFTELLKVFRNIYIANNVNGITLPKQVTVVTR